MGVSDTYKLFLDDARTGFSTGLSGRKLDIIGASDKNATADLQVVYADGSRRSFREFKDEYWLKSAKEFSDVIVSNTAQAGKYIIIEVTEFDETFEYERRRDFTISEITNDVPLDDADLIAAIQDVELSVDEVKAMMQNADDQRAGLTTLEGASYDEASNTTVTVVTSGANTAGIALRLGQITSTGTAYSYIRAGGNEILDVTGAAGTNGNKIVKDVLIPSGVDLTISTNSTAALVNVHYEVL